ncbi:MAG: HD domain-containing protein [Planctomycetales bacterium]|nr:HD domain-containing protein [Planctomycetales bacterium]
MAHLFIKDIGAGQQIQDVYMVTQPVLRNTTRGDLYIAMFLSDKTGKLNSRLWQATEELYQSIPSEGFVAIRGKSELYQGNLQLVVNEVQVVQPDQIKLSDYMPRTEKNITEMYEQVKAILKTIRNDDLKRLMEAFLNDQELMKQFCMAPAAMQMHHNYLGGLLEHTLNMLNAAQALFPLYPKIQKELVLAAIFLHDIAKTQELSYKIGLNYTDRGQLLGHIIQGTQLVTQKADDLKADGTPVNPQILDSLLHIIVSHHGQREFGSPVLPATPEAFMVNYIDNLDAKMNQTAALIENDAGDGGNWTSYQKSLETKLYRHRALGDG